MAYIGLVVGLHFLSGFVVSGTNSQEISKTFPDDDISRWRWPYNHEPKIPIPTEATTLATPKYDFQNEVGPQDSFPKERHSKKRRRRKKKRKGKKNIQQFSARDPEFHLGGPVVRYDPIASHEAKVHIMLPPGGGSESHVDKFRHPDDPDFHASATLMDFNEDPRVYLRPTESSKSSDGRVMLSDNTLPLSHVEEEMPPLHPKKSRRNRRKKNKRKNQSLDDSSKEKKKKKKKQMVKVRIPVRALVYQDAPTSDDDGSQYFKKRAKSPKHPVTSHPLITLHSPTRIFVPVWAKGEFSGSPHGEKQNCIRCPANATLIAKRGENTVFQTVPPVAICPSLARRPGTLNLAVTSGPRPGTKLNAGEYQVQLIAWKFRGHVSSCKYAVYVKVRKCPNVYVPGNLLMDCPNGTIWGSVCSFKCASKKHSLRGAAVRSCEENGLGTVDWTAQIPSCIADEPVSQPKIMKSCKEPKPITDGAVVCGAPKNSNKTYADQTICQYFCYPGFAMTLFNKSHNLIVCENGVWTPSIKMECIVDHCLQLEIDQEGVIFNCGENKGRILNGKMTFGNGSNCLFQCIDGFIELDDQRPIEKMTCLAPRWSSSAVPDCVRASPPTPHREDCRDTAFVVAPGESLIFGIDIRTPRFTSAVRSEVLTPTCTLSSKQLKRGLYTNRCEVKDPWTELTANCTYHVKIQERIPPKAGPGQCSDKIMYASESGTAVLKVPKFYSSSDADEKKIGAKILPATCTYQGNIGFGKYTNLCSAFDPDLNITGSCSYSIEVKAYSCPLLKTIPHAKLECIHLFNTVTTNIYPPDTVCEYSCTDGYAIPRKFYQRKVRRCLGSLRWNISVYPYCKKAISPQFHPEDCQYKIHYVEDSKDLVNLTLPRLKSNNRNGNLKVLCSLNENLSVGNYSNSCQVVDTESGLSSTCTYDITIRAKTCVPLEPIEFADIVCSAKEVEDIGHPISSVCSYVCHNDYVIPTSQLPLSTKACMANTLWNNTELPKCLEKVLPRLNSSCENEVISTGDLSNLTLPFPTFVSTIGNPISMNCSPPIKTIDDFGVFDISCDAYDVELRTSNNCDFTVTVLSLSVTEIPDLNEPPVPVEPGCTDYLLQARAGDTITLEYPTFITSRNMSADVICTSLNVTGQNLTQIVTCDAIDTTTNVSASCSFTVTLSYPQTEPPGIEEITTIPSQNCPQLTRPEDGYISCDSPNACQIGCNDGYGFSTDFGGLKEKSVYCDQDKGMWDFQNEYGTRMPDCLRELPTTSVEVWLQFKGEVEDCGDPALTGLQTKVTDSLLQMNDEVCQTLNCTEAFNFNCSHDNERNRESLTTTWTIRASASFDPQDYEDSDLVPLAETQLETILEMTQKAVTTDNAFKQEMLDMGLKLWQNSYSRGHIILVCNERGFVVDPRSDKCMECPRDHAEINHICEPCPENYYQNRTGQTSCIMCSQELDYDSTPAKCLLDDDVQ